MKGRLVGCSMGFVVMLLSLGGAGARAADETQASPPPLKLIANTSDMKAMMMAVGLNSLAKLDIDDFDIETIWVGEDTSILEAITRNNGHLQLVNLERIDGARLDDRSHLRAVMRLWRAERSENAEEIAADPGHLLVADASVPPGMIETLLGAIQADERILRGANIDIARLDPAISMVDPPIAWHQGVLDYLDAHRPLSPTARDAATAAVDTEADAPAEIDAVAEAKKALPDLTKLDGKSFTLYFKTNESVLDRRDMTSVVEACQFAATLPKARFVIAGHADTVGTMAYNTYLSRLRAQSAAKAIENDPRFREALSVIEFGEAIPAVPTADEVPEPMNRRVEIIVVQAD